MSTITSDSKRHIDFYKEHYLSVSATIFFVFTALCYFYCDRYFSEFDIDFFIFGGLGDVYQVALSNSVLGIILTVVVIMFMGMDLMFLTKKEDNRIISALMKVTGGSFFIFSLYLLFTLVFLDGPKFGTEQLKSGFSARYDLYTDGGQLNCQTIVGSTSEYLVTWDYFNRKSTIFLRSAITSLELRVGIPPGDIPKPSEFSIFSSDEKYRELKTKQDEWSNNLFTTCNQKVVWR